MDKALTLFQALNGGLVLIFGFILTLLIAGIPMNKRNITASSIAIVLLMAAQSALYFTLGNTLVRQLYPLLIHLPLLLFLTLYCKKPVALSLVSIFLSYLCCQFPLWIKLMADAVSGLELVGAICYTLSIAPIFYLLNRYFVHPARDVMTYSPATMYIFGSLPLAYYIFDYVTTVYSENLEVFSTLLAQFLPTATIGFYVFFLAAYHSQMMSQTRAELQRSLLESELNQSETEMENLRQADAQSAIYRHDFRHHLSMIRTFLAAGDSAAAEEYIRQVQTDMDALSVRRYCENETVNLLCSSFSGKAAMHGVRLNITAKIPKEFGIPDTELCAIIANGLENALHAADRVEDTEKFVDFYCEVKRNKLLLEIKNPYIGEVLMEDGIPVSNSPNHGYGCRSIQGITDKHRGLCAFETADGIFILRVVLPV